MRGLILFIVLAVCFTSPTNQALGQQATLAVSDGKVCSTFPGGAIVTVGAKLFFPTYFKIRFEDNYDNIRMLSDNGFETLKTGKCEFFLTTDIDKVGFLFEVYIIN